MITIGWKTYAVIAGLLVVLAIVIGAYFEGQSNGKSKVEVKQVKETLNQVKKAGKLNAKVNKIPDSGLDDEFSKHKWLRND